MHSRTIIAFGLVVACAIFSEVSAGGGGKGKWMEKMKKCGDGEVNTEELMKGMKECMQEGKKEGGDEESRRRRSPMEGGKKGKGKGGKRWKKHMCTAVCGWKKQGVLDESGQFSESGMQDYVNRAYPEDKREDIISKFKACADENSSTFSMDDNCSGYGKFKKCVMKSHAETCGLKGGKFGGEKEEEE